MRNASIPAAKKKTKEEVRPLLNRAGDLVIKEMEKSEVFNAFVPPFLLVRFFLRCPSSFTLVTESVGVKHYPQQTMIKWGTSKANWTYKSPWTQTSCIWLGWFHCKAALLKDHGNWERFLMTGKSKDSFAVFNYLVGVYREDKGRLFWEATGTGQEAIHKSCSMENSDWMSRKFFSS